MREKLVDVKPGTVIHTEKPFVHILSSKLRAERCDHCFQNKKLLKCSGCQYIYYCGRSCQKESWPVHKFECANLRLVAPRVVPDAARLLARLIIRLKNGGDMVKAYYTQTSFRKFKDLMSHYSDIKDDQKRMEHFTSLCGVLFEYLGETVLPNSAELMGIYGRMCVNSFNILDPEMTSIGTGVYLGASIIDHSCQPNALAVFEGTTIFIRTLETLPIMDWAQVFISYIDLLNTPEDRQKELEATYYFRCKCPPCLDENQLMVMQSAACPNAACSALVSLEQQEDNATMKCEECEEEINEEFLTNFELAVDFTMVQLQEMKNMTYIDVCKMCLKKQKGLLHPVHLLHVKTLDLAFESSIQLGLWDEAEEYGIQLIPGYIKYYGNIHPLLGLLYLKVGKILVYKNKSSTALEYLKEAGRILRITHGDRHTLYKESFVPLMQQATMESAVITA